MNLINQTFGRLRVIEQDPTDRKKVVCQCDCGRCVSVRATSLTKKKAPTRSYGCIQREKARIIGANDIARNSRAQIQRNLLLNTNTQVIATDSPPRNNTSGHKGISWDREKQKWHCYLNVHNHRIFLGYYDEYNDAVEARKRAEERHHIPILDELKRSEHLNGSQAHSGNPESH